VALILRRRGIERVRPLAGGFYGWRDRGFPVTPMDDPARPRDHARAAGPVTR
jgi:3-mercaptopyruvate sulfurtransferase SseA